MVRPRRTPSAPSSTGSAFVRQGRLERPMRAVRGPESSTHSNARTSASLSKCASRQRVISLLALLLRCGICVQPLHCVTGKQMADARGLLAGSLAWLRGSWLERLRLASTAQLPVGELVQRKPLLQPSGELEPRGSARPLMAAAPLVASERHLAQLPQLPFIPEMALSLRLS
jgi:hypothetical protein